MTGKSKITCILICLMLTALFTEAHAGDIGYISQIKPIFDSKCISCHGQNAAPEHYAFKAEKEKWLSKGQGMRMDTYSHLVFYISWPDTGALMRRLDDGKNTKDGKPGNMYQYLGSTEEERQQNLKLFKDWVGNWTLKKRKDITKEEMEGIKVKY